MVELRLVTMVGMNDFWNTYDSKRPLRYPGVWISNTALPTGMNNACANAALHSRYRIRYKKEGWIRVAAGGRTYPWAPIKMQPCWTISICSLTVIDVNTPLCTVTSTLCVAEYCLANLHNLDRGIISTLNNQWVQWCLLFQTFKQLRFVANPRLDLTIVSRMSHVINSTCEHNVFLWLQTGRVDRLPNTTRTQRVTYCCTWLI